MAGISTVTHILIIDDDTRTRTLLARFLHDNGYITSMACNAQEARTKLKTYQFDLLIVDIMMPGESGIELTRDLRKTLQTPILMLTARGDVEDRIEGLSIGANDYLPKPFEPRELLLRIQNILGRPVPNASPMFQFGPFSFHLDTDKLFHHDTLIPLTSSENQLLKALCMQSGTPVSREVLVSVAGGISERSIDVQITRLRTKIEDNPKKPLYLKTLRGKGYVLYGKHLS